MLVTAVSNSVGKKTNTFFYSIAAVFLSLLLLIPCWFIPLERVGDVKSSLSPGNKILFSKQMSSDRVHQFLKKKKGIEP